MVFVFLNLLKNLKRKNKLPSIIKRNTRKRERELMDSIRLKETKRTILSIQAKKDLTEFDALLRLLHDKGVL